MPAAKVGKRTKLLIAATTVWEGSVGWTVECLPFTDGILDRYRRAGFNHLSLTVAAEWHGLEATLRHLLKQRDWFARRSKDYLLVENVDDIEMSRADGRLAVSFNFQGAGPFAGEPLLVDHFRSLGVRLVIPTYNTANALGDGCQETRNAGLTALGRRFVAEMNRCGVVIDLTHVGARTALDIIECSTDPVVFSHSNPSDVYPHIRNISAELIRGCAKTGGVVGLNSLSFMLAKHGRSDVGTFCHHIEHVAGLVGPEHVALGMDWNFYDPFMQRMFAENPGMAQLGYPPPPWGSLAPQSLPQIVEHLLTRGWSDRDIAGLLGNNMVRVARKVWR